jgi:TolB-like protein/tetratricopeptide (TPR) repeat protein/predicted Ser/Thr protein kinase
MGVKCSKCNTENTSDSQFCKSCATPLPSSKEIPVTETLETPKEELTTGSTFAGRFQIIEELGKGGMGKVYKAIDKKLNEEVALKVIKPEIASDKKTLERFNNELKLARKIAHKNVGRMYELMEEKGTHFITMEYVPGQDLRGLIRQTGQLTVGTAVSIAKQVCEGLTEAHRLGVIHRDLKPQNIMIDKEGNSRIMDFGIARSLKEKGITGAGVMVGTPEYMSPEQVESKEVDQRSDIYSLGVILYEMVTGRVPFEGETPLGIAMKHKSEIPKDPREVNAQILKDLRKCMEKDKEKRYQNTEELLSKLEKMKSVTTETITVPEWKNSIAVLPFKNMSADPEQEYFCEGMAEELINNLAQITDLRVVARTSAFSFRDKDVDIREIGRKLNVDKVLEGSVRKAGNRLRITAQLINVSDGYDLWSERYDREMEDVFTIQDEVTLAIVDTLKVKLLGREKAMLRMRPTDDQEAYNLYLKGRYFWYRRYEGSLQKGLEYFYQAIKKDSSYASAYAGIADSLSILGIFWLPPKEVFPKAKEAALKAIEIDNTLAEAYTSLGFISFAYDWDWIAAERAFKQSLAHDPKYALGYLWYATYLSWMGRFEEATEAINKALELEPFSLVINVNLGHVSYFKKQYDEAIKHGLKSVELDPNFLQSYFYLAWGYQGKEKWKEMIAAQKKAVALSDDSPFFLGWLGMGFGLSGQKEKAQKMLDRLEKMSKNKYVSPINKALIFLALDEKDQMFEHLERAYEAKVMWLASIKTNPLFDSVRSDLRFKELLKKMNLE